ncbi:MAG: RNA polymerase sigma factor [Lachnospira sp.]|nr:RNA polymerase sigma factor [Lachnospira sp.]
MSDEKLLKLVKHNPDKGISEAMKIYGKAVNTICRSILGDLGEEFVEEAVSDTFFKLWKNNKQFVECEGHSLKSWLYSVARNSATDIRRKNAKHILSLDDENQDELMADISIESEVQKKELKAILQKVIEELGEPDSKVFLLKYFLCMKNREIAAKLGISEKKAENILYRGKVKLKEKLTERGITGYGE